MVGLLRTDSRNADFIKLSKLLDSELYLRYGILQDQFHKFNSIDRIDTVVLATKELKAVGCGCFRKYDFETIEIKRMFVAPDYRRQGISLRILDELENWARELNYKHAILETANRQPEALNLYLKNGYLKVRNFGPYTDIPESICMMKKLTI